ncbi:AraC family transcriptional regulator [Blautia sp. RD014234]|nr:AraC family transcriptional regulator [Blautia parvula]
MGVNHTYLSKLFKEDTGENFVGYLTDYRVGKAKELIERRQYKIKDIYALVGFSSYNYFLKYLKRQWAAARWSMKTKKV